MSHQRCYKVLAVWSMICYCLIRCISYRTIMLNQRRENSKASFHNNQHLSFLMKLHVDSIFMHYAILANILYKTHFGHHFHANSDIFHYVMQYPTYSSHQITKPLYLQPFSAKPSFYTPLSNFHTNNDPYSLSCRLQHWLDNTLHIT